MLSFAGLSTFSFFSEKKYKHSAIVYDRSKRDLKLLINIARELCRWNYNKTSHAKIPHKLQG